MDQNRLPGNGIHEAQNPFQVGVSWALDVGTCLRGVFKGDAMDPLRPGQLGLSVRRLPDAHDVPIRCLAPENAQTLGLATHQEVALQALQKHLRHFAQAGKSATGMLSFSFVPAQS